MYDNGGQLTEKDQYSRHGNLYHSELFFYDSNKHHYLTIQYSYIYGYFDTTSRVFIYLDSLSGIYLDTTYRSIVHLDSLSRIDEESISERSILREGLHVYSSSAYYKILYTHYPTGALQNVCVVNTNDSIFYLYDDRGNLVASYCHNYWMLVSHNYFLDAAPIASISIHYNYNGKQITYERGCDSGGKIGTEHLINYSGSSFDRYLSFEYDRSNNTVALTFNNRIFRNVYDSSGTLHLADSVCVYNGLNQLTEKVICEPFDSLNPTLRCCVWKYKYTYGPKKRLTRIEKSSLYLSDIVGQVLFGNITYVYKASGELIQEHYEHLYKGDPNADWFEGSDDTYYYVKGLLVQKTSDWNGTFTDYYYFSYEYY